MPALFFKKPLFLLILEGRKTQTRRLRPLWKEGCIYTILGGPGLRAYVRITKYYRQRLGDITPAQVKAEGFNNLEEFKTTWIKLFGSWNPETEVHAYEFELIQPRKILRPAP